MTISPKLYIRRNGGIAFWRLGRLGGSFYCTKPQTEWEIAFHAERWLVRATVMAISASLIGCAF